MVALRSQLKKEVTEVIEVTEVTIEEVTLEEIKETMITMKMIQ